MSEEDRDEDVERWNEVVHELRAMARALMRKESRQITLQTTVLINDCFLRIANSKDAPADWSDPKQFFRYAPHLMTQILIDYARKRNAPKRGGDYQRISMEFASDMLSDLDRLGDETEELLAILEQFREQDPELHELIMLRFAFGFTHEQIAQQMGVSPRTAAERWSYARKRIGLDLEQGRTGN